jgi:hypothetical protein
LYFDSFKKVGTGLLRTLFFSLASIILAAARVHEGLDDHRRAKDRKRNRGPADLPPGEYDHKRSKDGRAITGT